MVNMKNILPRAAFIVLASLASIANADLKITAPSSDIWWVAKSINVLTWTCQDSPVDSFTVSIANSDPKILVSPLPIISIQQNSQCSIEVSQDQANQPAGTGWTITFSNILNLTDIVATSEPFEIKPLGSLYPSQVTPSPNSSASASATDSSSSTKPTSAASSVNGKGMAAGLVGGLVFGAVGMML